MIKVHASRKALFKNVYLKTPMNSSRLLRPKSKSSEKISIEFKYTSNKH